MEPVAFAMCERLAVILLLAALLLSGCASPEVARLAAEKVAAEREVARLQQETAALRNDLAAAQQQAQTLRALGEKRLELLFQVKSLDLGRYTAGYDSDGKPGDEGVRVYLAPIDREGSAIKAAGAVAISLYDLAQAPGRELVGTYNWPVEQIGKQWVSGFLASHFRFDCPWQSGPPAHDEITVRVVFTDYLTGKTFTTQGLAKINLPPVARPSRP